MERTLYTIGIGYRREHADFKSAIPQCGIIRNRVSLDRRFNSGGWHVSSLFPELYDRALAKLVGARKSAKITQVELAKKLGRPQSFVSKYEMRERLLDMAEFVSIARILGADPYRLLRASESEEATGTENRR